MVQRIPGTALQCSSDLECTVQTAGCCCSGGFTPHPAHPVHRLLCCPCFAVCIALATRPAREGWLEWTPESSVGLACGGRRNWVGTSRSGWGWLPIPHHVRLSLGKAPFYKSQ